MVYEFERLNSFTSHLIQASKHKKEWLYIIDIFKYHIFIDYKQMYCRLVFGTL